MLPPDRCYEAIRARDPRFDGWFVTAVTTTRIYCRPSCPARTPHRENVRFYATAAAAQAAGFRACLRCRPDAAPGSPEWNVRADLAGRALRLIGDGVVDREGVAGLARRLGYTERHVHRQLVAEVGAGPIAIARAQRAHTARVLIETTPLPFTEVAFAAGHVACVLRLADLRDLASAVQRCRRALDLDSDPVAVDEHLAADPLLAPLVAAGPGRRVPGAVDGPELAVRAVLGQQVSVPGARTVAGRLVQGYGEPLDVPD